MASQNRYLQFDNIDLDCPNIWSRCSRCRQAFNAVSKFHERFHDVLLRVRADFDRHICGSTSHDIGGSMVLDPGPPPGWIDLQQRMMRAKTAKEVTEIADEMKSLLDAFERKTGSRPQSRRPPNDAPERQNR